MKKVFIFIMSVIASILVFSVSVSAVTYTVASGDTMWKIAVRHEVGLSEIKAANPHIANPDLIYPGQVLNIPTTDSSVLSYEKEVEI